MSCCWTFLLKRRNTFSRGSPSCKRTSAKLYTPPNLTLLDNCEFCSHSWASQALSCSKCVFSYGFLTGLAGKSQRFSARRAAKQFRHGTPGLNVRMTSPLNSIISGRVMQSSRVGRFSDHQITPIARSPDNGESFSIDKRIRLASIVSSHTTLPHYRAEPCAPAPARARA
jgi:hypothetical protein